MIWTGDEIELRNAASAITLDMIHAEEQEAPTDLRALFEIIRHGFDVEKKLSLRRFQVEAHDPKRPTRRSFQRFTGQTLSHYLREARHAMSARMLIHTELAAKRIALLMGHATASSFSKAFHAHCGLTPTQYRRQARFQLKRCKPRKD